MIRLFQVTVNGSGGYAGPADVDFTTPLKTGEAAGTPPQRVKMSNQGASGVFVSRDGVADHDYFAAREVTTYFMNLAAVNKLWFRLAAAGAQQTFFVVEY